MRCFESADVCIYFGKALNHKSCAQDVCTRVSFCVCYLTVNVTHLLVKSWFIWAQLLRYFEGLWSLMVTRLIFHNAAINLPYAALMRDRSVNNLVIAVQSRFHGAFWMHNIFILGIFVQQATSKE